jgi:hypothetical protein
VTLSALWMIAAEDLFSGAVGILADCPTLY